MQNQELKLYLIKRLKQANAFWSYNVESIKDVPDNLLVELVMLHLDLDDIDKLFELYSFKKVKNAWIRNLVAQGERYYILNRFLAWYYFHVKRPGPYVKAMATRELNKKFVA